MEKKHLKSAPEHNNTQNTTYNCETYHTLAYSHARTHFNINIHIYACEWLRDKNLIYKNKNYVQHYFE